jgi:hypothetical protein
MSSAPLEGRRTRMPARRREYHDGTLSGTLSSMTVPAWLADRPSYLARLMMWRNVLRRSKLARSLGIGACAALVAPAVPAVMGWPAAGALARELATHPAIVFAVAAVLCAAVASRRRRRIARERAGDWVAALPVVEPPFERAAVAALASLGALEWMLAALMAAARSPARTVGASLLVAAAGAVAGFWAGWFVPRASRAQALRSRHAGHPRARARWATRAALTPLGFWALAETRWWGRPRISARWAALATLVLPMGTPGAAALGFAGACVLALYLVLLTLAVVRVTFAASWWLAPTGIGPARFTASAAGLALLAQAGICGLALCGCEMLGGPRALAVGAAMAAAGWLSSASLEALSGLAALRAGRIAASRLHRWLA